MEKPGIDSATLYLQIRQGGIPCLFVSRHVLLVFLGKSKASVQYHSTTVN